MINRSKNKFTNSIINAECELGDKNRLLMPSENDGTPSGSDSTRTTQPDNFVTAYADPAENSASKSDDGFWQGAGYLGLGLAALATNPVTKGLINPVELVYERKLRDPMTAMKTRTALYTGKALFTLTAVKATKFISKDAGLLMEETLEKGYAMGMHNTVKFATHFDAIKKITEDVGKGQYAKALNDGYDEMMTTEVTNVVSKPVSWVTRKTGLNSVGKGAVNLLQKGVDKIPGNTGESLSNFTKELFTFDNNQVSYFSNITKSLKARKAARLAKNAAEAGETGTVVEETSNVVSKATNTTNAAAETGNLVVDASGNIIENTSNVTKGVTTGTEGTAAIVNTTEATVNVASKTSFLTKSLDGLLVVIKSPALKVAGELLGPALPAYDLMTSGDKIDHANAELSNTKGKTAEQIETLRSERSEGYVKTTIASGALVFGTGLLLMSNPVGWTVLAGYGLYAAGDWIAEKFLHKSISSSIGDGARWVGDKVSDAADWVGDKVSGAWNWMFGSHKKKAPEVHTETAQVVTPTHLAQVVQPQITIPVPAIVQPAIALPEMTKNEIKEAGHFAYVDKIKVMQVKVNEKFKGALKEDGLLGEKTINFLEDHGMLSAFGKSLDLDDKAITMIKKHAKEHDQEFFKALSHSEKFAGVTKNGMDKALVMLDHVKDGKFDQNEYYASQTKDVKIDFKGMQFNQFNVADSTGVKRPTLLPKDLLVKNTEQEHPNRT